MGIADAVLETGGCERFGGGAFSLVERRLRAGIGWYVGVGSSAGVLIWDKGSDGRLSAIKSHSSVKPIRPVKAECRHLDLRIESGHGTYNKVVVHRVGTSTTHSHMDRISRWG